MIPEIPEREHLGNLVTCETSWQRPITTGHVGDKEWQALEEWCRENKCRLGVTGEGNLAYAYGRRHSQWSVIKDKPFDLISKENGGAEVIIENWRGTYQGVRFGNGKALKFKLHDYPDDIPVEVDETGRCESLTKEGTRCMGSALSCPYHR